MTNDNDFLRNWLEGNVSSEELAARKIKGDETVSQFEKLIEQSSKLRVPEKQTKEQAWQKLTNRISEERKPIAREVKLNWRMLTGIAASFALVFVAYVFFFATTSVSTQLAETKTYLLPDGSEIHLNVDSKISFKKNIWMWDRSVTLEGEAFFKVKKGSRFTVTSNAATVTVLGTSFNVNAREGAEEVSCFTGKVKVNYAKKEVILTKGEFTKIENDSLVPPTKFDKDKIATWRTGEFFFDCKPLSIVIDELERQFNVTIEFEGDTTRLYTGYFNTKTLDEALLMVFKPMSLSYTKVNGKKIIIK
jgi:transmembrane sensor